MPYVRLQVAGSLTRDQKKEIAKRFAHTLKEVANKPLSATYLVFEEVKRENWAIGENLLDERV